MTSKERKRERARERRRAKSAVEATGPEQVGYRNPPKHSQFKPGKSGNPSGRPKGKRSFNDIVERSVMTMVEVNSGGRRKRVPALEAILLRAVNKALQGDLQSQKMVMTLYEGRGLSGPAAGSKEAEVNALAGARESLRLKLEAAVEEALAAEVDNGGSGKSRE